MEKTITVEKKVYMCDRCGKELSDSFSLCQCEACGKPTCCICGTRYEFNFIHWHNGLGRHYYFDVGILAGVMRDPRKIREIYNEERYLCPDCVPEIDKKLRELGFVLIERG